ncbi:hypothetical protein [Nostoc sp.]|uniref:hypothetical protein n=1 Tax=Nostoc sp. TaxID=1180 RepID=UPI002FFD3FBE
MNLNLALLGFILSLIVTISGWVFRWNDKKKFERQQGALERHQSTQEAVRLAEKTLNEERDFNHLRNNQIQISDGIARGFKEIEYRLDIGFKDTQIKLDKLNEEQIETKAYLIRNQPNPKE